MASPIRWCNISYRSAYSPKTRTGNAGGDNWPNKMFSGLTKLKLQIQLSKSKSCRAAEEIPRTRFWIKQALWIQQSVVMPRFFYCQRTNLMDRIRVESTFHIFSGQLGICIWEASSNLRTSSKRNIRIYAILLGRRHFRTKRSIERGLSSPCTT